MYRQIIGKIGNIALNNPFPVDVSFSLHPGTFTGDTHYPKQIYRIKTANDGSFIVSLWTNKEGFLNSFYTCSFLEDQFDFILPPGDTPIALAQLRIIGTGIEIPAPEDETAPTSFFETFIPSTGQTIFSLLRFPVDPTQTLFYVNGIKAMASVDFIVNGLTVTWLNRYTLDSLDLLEVYYS